MKMTATSRRSLSKALSTPILGGIRKTTKVGEGLAEVTRILSENGFSLDMVTGDTVMGTKGSRLLSFRRSNTPDMSPFDEFPAYENTFVSFTWEALGPNTIEIIAYLS